MVDKNAIEQLAIFMMLVDIQYAENLLSIL
jgi:hypothetical protein